MLKITTVFRGDSYVNPRTRTAPPREASSHAVAGERGYLRSPSNLAEIIKFAPLWVCVLLAACAHPRPPLQSSVAIPATMIKATSHGFSSAGDTKASSFTQQAMIRPASADRPQACALPGLAAAPRQAESVGHYLVLSGGSLHGAFGAGLFLGLQEAGILPAEPDVVTGVSTGSLQATFLFLARQQVPRDRDYSWQGGLATQEGSSLPAIKGGRSNIEDLALAYSIRKEREILKPVPLGGVGMLIQGTKGSLAPLRRRLLGLISPETIREVATEACRGRKLFVGVTNVDDGQGYALDLTALALRAYDGDATPQLMTLVRKAYVESLIASSSVPVGAKPVRLRIRDFDKNEHRINLFIDGGARFGVFFQEIRAIQAANKQAGGGSGDVTLIVNTRLATNTWHDGDQRDPKEGWLLMTLGLRTVDILESQVYHLSVDTVETKAAELGGLHMSYISNENIAGGEEPDDHRYRGKTCEAWHLVDRQALHPIQFYPAYMACLIDYGRERGRRGEWNTNIIGTEANAATPAERSPARGRQ